MTDVAAPRARRKKPTSAGAAAAALAQAGQIPIDHTTADQGTTGPEILAPEAEEETWEGGAERSGHGVDQGANGYGDEPPADDAARGLGQESKPVMSYVPNREAAAGINPVYAAAAPASAELPFGGRAKPTPPTEPGLPFGTAVELLPPLFKRVMKIVGTRKSDVYQTEILMQAFISAEAVVNSDAPLSEQYTILDRLVEEFKRTNGVVPVQSSLLGTYTPAVKVRGISRNRFQIRPGKNIWDHLDKLAREYYDITRTDLCRIVLEAKYPPPPPRVRKPRRTVADSVAKVVDEPAPRGAMQAAPPETAAGGDAP